MQTVRVSVVEHKMQLQIIVEIVIIALRPGNLMN
jgi:hypothetical protein